VLCSSLVIFVGLVAADPGRNRSRSSAAPCVPAAAPAPLSPAYFRAVVPAKTLLNRPQSARYNTGQETGADWCRRFQALSLLCQFLVSFSSSIFLRLAFHCRESDSRSTCLSTSVLGPICLLSLSAIDGKHGDLCECKPELC
jgi:hypothetical protein